MDEGQIYWFTGNTGAGKTTYAKQFIDWIHKHVGIPVIHLDGDVLRNDVFEDSDFSTVGRWQHNIRTARLAKMLAEQGNIVVVSLICPYHALQQRVKEITECIAIRVDGGAPDSLETPYQPWREPNIVLRLSPRNRILNVNWHNVFISAK